MIIGLILAAAPAFFQAEGGGKSALTLAADTKASLVAGPDRFEAWVATNAKGEVLPRPDLLDCQADPADHVVQVCTAKPGVEGVGGRFAGLCFQGIQDDARKIVNAMIANPSGEAGDRKTIVTLDKVKTAKDGTSLSLAYRLGRSDTKIQILRQYVVKSCAAPATVVAGSKATSLVFASVGAGDYTIVRAGSKAPGTLLARSGCYKGSVVDVCAMVASMAKNAGTVAGVYNAADGKTCEVAGDKVRVSLAGWSDYPAAGQPETSTGATEIAPCAAGAFADKVYLAVVAGDGTERRVTAAATGGGPFWMDAAAPFAGACFAPAQGRDACAVVEKVAGKAVGKCAFVAKSKRLSVDKALLSPCPG